MNFIIGIVMLAGAFALLTSDEDKKKIAEKVTGKTRVVKEKVAEVVKDKEVVKDDGKGTTDGD